MYTQNSLKDRSKLFAEQFSNVHAFADADFDMDIDPNFHESESLFYDALDHLRRIDG